MGSGFVFKAMPHVLGKEMWGESTMLSIQLESEENGASRNRHKLVQSWSFCRYTHTHTEQHLGDSVSIATSGKKAGWTFMDTDTFLSVPLLVIMAKDW